jgi:hypothetical protein
MISIEALDCAVGGVPVFVQVAACRTEKNRSIHWIRIGRFESKGERSLSGGSVLSPRGRGVEGRVEVDEVDGFDGM